MADCERADRAGTQRAVRAIARIAASVTRTAEATQLDKRSADLALAASHVERGQIIVARQRELITRLKALGCSTFDHECSLKVFATTLETFVAHERALRKGPGASAKLVAQLRRQRSNYAGLDVR